MPSDIVIAKNYLDKEELKHFDRIGNMYLDYAENQANRQIKMTMNGLVERLDAFLEFNDYKVLDNAGSISAKIAQKLVDEHYEKFRLTQDDEFRSDFDKEVKKLAKGKDK